MVAGDTRGLVDSEVAAVGDALGQDRVGVREEDVLERYYDVVVVLSMSMVASMVGGASTTA